MAGPRAAVGAMRRALERLRCRAVAALPESITAGVHSSDCSLELVVCILTFGLMTVLLIIWRGIRSIRSRHYAVRERELASELASQFNKKCQQINKVILAKQELLQEAEVIKEKVNELNKQKVKSEESRVQEEQVLNGRDNQIKLNASLKALEGERDQICTQVSEVDKTTEDLTERIRCLESEQTSLSSEITELQKKEKLQQKPQVMTELYQEKEMKLHRKLTIEENYRLEKEKKHSKVKEKVKHASEELETCRQRVKDLEEELERTIHFHQGQVQELEAAIKQRDCFMTQLAANLQQVTKEKDETMKEFLELTEQSKKLQIQFQRVNNEEQLKLMNVTMSELNIKLQDILSQKEKLREELCVVKGEKCAQQHQLDDLLDESGLLRDQVQKSRDIIDEQESKLNEAYKSLSTVESLKAEIAAASETKKEMELKHDAEITNYKIKLEMLEKEKNTVLDRMAESQEAELEHLRMQVLFRHKEELQKLKDDLEAEHRLNLEDMMKSYTPTDQVKQLIALKEKSWQEEFEILSKENEDLMEQCSHLNREIERQRNTFSFAEKNFEVNYQELKEKYARLLRVKDDLEDNRSRQTLQYESIIKALTEEVHLQKGKHSDLNDDKMFLAEPLEVSEVVEKDTTELMEKLKVTEREKVELSEKLSIISEQLMQTRDEVDFLSSEVRLLSQEKEQLLFICKALEVPTNLKGTENATECPVPVSSSQAGLVTMTGTHHVEFDSKISEDWSKEIKIIIEDGIPFKESVGEELMLLTAGELSPGGGESREKEKFQQELCIVQAKQDDLRLEMEAQRICLSLVYSTYADEVRHAMEKEKDEALRSLKDELVSAQENEMAELHKVYQCKLQAFQTQETDDGKEPLQVLMDRLQKAASKECHSISETLNSSLDEHHTPLKCEMNVEENENSGVYSHNERLHLQEYRYKVQDGPESPEVPSSRNDSNDEPGNSKVPDSPGQVFVPPPGPPVPPVDPRREFMARACSLPPPSPSNIYRGPPGNYFPPNDFSCPPRLPLPDGPESPEVPSSRNDSNDEPGNSKVPDSPGQVFVPPPGPPVPPVDPRREFMARACSLPPPSPSNIYRGPPGNYFPPNVFSGPPRLPLPDGPESPEVPSSRNDSNDEPGNSKVPDSPGQVFVPPPGHPVPPVDPRREFMARACSLPPPSPSNIYRGPPGNYFPPNVFSGPPRLPLPDGPESPEVLSNRNDSNDEPGNSKVPDSPGQVFVPPPGPPVPPVDPRREFMARACSLPPPSPSNIYRGPPGNYFPPNDFSCPPRLPFPGRNVYPPRGFPPYLPPRAGFFPPAPHPESRRVLSTEVIPPSKEPAAELDGPESPEVPSSRNDSNDEPGNSKVPDSPGQGFVPPPGPPVPPVDPRREFMARACSLPPPSPSNIYRGPPGNYFPPNDFSGPPRLPFPVTSYSSTTSKVAYFKRKYAEEEEDLHQDYHGCFPKHLILPEDRTYILKLSLEKLRFLKGPETYLRRSVLINNLWRKIQLEMKKESYEYFKESPSYKTANRIQESG